MNISINTVIRSGTDSSIWQIIDIDCRRNVLTDEWSTNVMLVCVEGESVDAVSTITVDQIPLHFTVVPA